MSGLCLLHHVILYIFPLSYRTREEIEEVRRTRDPINNFKKRLIQAGLATEEELEVGVVNNVFVTK